MRSNLKEVIRHRIEMDARRQQEEQQRRMAMPPDTRPHGLGEEDMADALTFYEANTNRFPHEFIENIIYLTFAELREEERDSIPRWIEVATRLHDELGRVEIRRNVEVEPFIDQLFNMLRLSGLTARDWNIMVGSVIVDLSDDNKEKMAKMVSACRYQGFDPSVILKKIVRSWRQGGAQNEQVFTMQVETREGTENFRYTNKESLLDDMTFLILIFLNRGAVIDKIGKKSARDFQAVLRMLVAKYEIRHNEEVGRRRRAEALAPEVVTLPRISACFAQLTTVLFHEGFGRTIANLQADLPNTPNAIFSPMFPSVVRKGEIINGTMSNIHPQLVLIAILNDNVLHSRDRVTPLDQIWTYYLAAHNSNVLVDDARIEQCNRFEVTQEGLFVRSITERRDHCIMRIRELRPHERINDFVLEMNTLP